ncbi:YCF48-related protein [Pelobium sp.]|nr:YCF48-related protein [Pelobium sp.]MDA9555310.1 YCF48-related protein [Pelobium sp.]
MMVALAFFKIAGAQSFKTLTLDSGKNTSLRGLSVLSDKVAWVSGSNGWVAKTTDGKTFNWQKVEGFEKVDFRDIEAFSENEAIVVNAGSPAYILKTTDGGETWKKVYENKDSLIFLDGMDFWNKREGIIFGDPMNGLMQILITKDGGETWENISAKANIKLNKGEAGFAASGTSIRTYKNSIFIATGGTSTRLWMSNDKGKTWENTEIPLIKGEPSTGTFSIAVHQNQVFAVGGDYLKAGSNILNYAIFNSKTKEWKIVAQPPKGYRSAIEIIDANLLISTGPSGTDYSIDSGQTWQALNLEGFNTCRKAKKGNLVLFTGAKGKIARLE